MIETTLPFLYKIQYNCLNNIDLEFTVFKDMRYYIITLHFSPFQ